MASGCWPMMWTREPHYVNFYPDLIPTRSELSVPIRSGDQTIGVLDIQSPRLERL